MRWLFVLAWLLVAGPLAFAQGINNPLSTTVNGQPCVSGGSCNLPIGMVTAAIQNVDLNTLGDTPISISIPPGYSHYYVWQVFLRNVGTVASLSSAQAGIFTAAGGAGNVVSVGTSVMTSITSNAANTPANGAGLATNAPWAMDTTVTTLYFRVTQVQSAGAAIDVVLYLRLLP